MTEGGQGQAGGTSLPSRRLVLGAGLAATVSALGLWRAGDLELAYGGPTRDGAARRAVDGASVSWAATPLRQVALTFDDGPDPVTTPMVLDLLARHGVKATFFVVGSNVLAHRAVAERIIAEGHTLANHTYDHAPLEQLAGRDVRDQLVRTRALLDGLDGGPRLVRPPRGYTSPLVTQVCSDVGERQVFWSSCLENQPEKDDVERGRRYGRMLDRGDVALLHDGGHVAGRWAQSYDRAGTVRALDALLAGLGERGVEAVTLPRLLAGATASA